MVAVNPGSLASHEKWSAQFGFNFPVAVDADRQVAGDFGALKENGSSIQRSVFIVDKAGVVRYAQEGMPTTEELLAALDSINAG